ncbi:hypothetical protein ACFXG4_34330 [Nocardia sp. NPDC059246]|uniref:hypothetical protein n=1 Tax=unclassified Nocardia TaxID=2637762 RepID=UPI003697511C
MSEQENIARQDAELRAQLRLFCQLMLGSADAADCMIQQIYQENWPSERLQLFRIAAARCGIRR